MGKKNVWGHIWSARFKKKCLGDKWNYSLDEVAAISNYLGRQGTRNYFAAVRDGKEYTPPGMNKTVEQYLKEYREATND